MDSWSGGRHWRGDEAEQGGDGKASLKSTKAVLIQSNVDKYKVMYIENKSFIGSFVLF